MNGKDSRRRWWLMRALAIALSLSPLVVLEFALRWFEEPDVTNAIDREPLMDLSQLRPLFELNADGTRWEIPESRYNFFRPDSFDAVKRENAQRIFVLGGSTVQGRPYAIETAFSTWLRLRLEANQPDIAFEVVNCGGISYASYRVDRILDEALLHQPDAIVIYTGHNEFLEDREYAEVRSMSAPRRLMARTASKLATVRWIQRTFSEPTAFSPSRMSDEVDALLDHSGGLEKYWRDDAWRSDVEEHFDQTLRRMVQRAQSAEVPVVVCIPASDLVQTPPFKVTPPHDLGEQKKEQLTQQWNRANNIDSSVSDRLAAARQCLEIDPSHAGASFVAGRLLFDGGDIRQAIPLLVAAKDHDVCPLRATSPIMETVRKVATEMQIPCIDTPSLLDTRDGQGVRRPDGIPDPSFFVDHLHPSVAGHQSIASAIANELTDLEWAQPIDDSSESRYQQIANKHLAGLGEDYYLRGKQRLEGLRRWASGRAGQIDDPTDIQTDTE
ncbi:MAG: hypothetical protein AAGI63_07365 [Planctomycetota bacterium]